MMFISLMRERLTALFPVLMMQRSSAFICVFRRTQAVCIPFNSMEIYLVFANKQAFFLKATLFLQYSDLRRWIAIDICT